MLWFVIVAIEDVGNSNCYKIVEYFTVMVCN